MSCVPGAFWTAVAERSGDTAFARATRFEDSNASLALESAVAAVALPAQSKWGRAATRPYLSNIFNFPASCVGGWQAVPVQT